VLNLLKRLQIETGIAYLMITHNLATLRFLSGQVAVMQGGRIVEQGATDTVLDQPRHPCTRESIAAARATEGGSLDALATAGGALEAIAPTG
jgi:peptide/nickel transport system ATP-binding protein